MNGGWQEEGSEHGGSRPYSRGGEAQLVEKRDPFRACKPKQAALYDGDGYGIIRRGVEWVGDRRVKGQ